MSGQERAGNAEMAARQVMLLYADAVATLLDKVASRLARGIDRQGWAEAKLAELAQLQRDLTPLVGQLDTQAAGQARQLVQHAYDLGAQGVAATNVLAVEALAADLAGTLTAANRRVLRWAHDVYRDVIGQAVGQTATGAMSLREATQVALARFADRGVTGFVDTTGASWRLDSYAEMAVRSGTMRAHLTGTVDRLRTRGDLVMVAAAGGACPLCFPWEGQVLSLGGLTPGYTLLADAQGAGLFHVNCRHDVDYWSPGLTTPAEHVGGPDDWQLLARQRELERRVRDSRRRLAAVRPLGETRRLAYEQRLLSRRRAALSAHIDAHGLKRWVSQQRTAVRTP